MGQRLTEQQQLFCEYYAQTYNASQSYRMAYPDCHSQAGVKGYKLLQRDYIKERIRQIQAEMVERAAINSEKIALLLDDIATDKDEKTSDRIKALDLLQKQYGLQKTKVEQEQKTTIEINIVGDENA